MKTKLFILGTLSLSSLFSHADTEPSLNLEKYNAVLNKKEKERVQLYNVNISNIAANFDAKVSFENGFIYIPVKFFEQELLNNLNTNYIVNYQNDTSLKISDTLIVKKDDDNLTLIINLDPSYLKDKDFSFDRIKASPAKSIDSTYLNYQFNFSNDKKFKLGELDFNYKSKNNWAFQNLMTSANDGLVRYSTRFSQEYKDKSSLVVGDTTNRVIDGFNPLNFFGLKYSTPYFSNDNYINSLLPPLAIQGVAIQPSRLDIYLNNQLIQKDDISAGKYNINLNSLGNGFGEAAAYVYDATGQPVIFTVPFYSSPDILKKGASEYSTNIGFIRKDLGFKSNSYGEVYASLFHKYGVSDRFTQDSYIAYSPSYSVLSEISHFVVSPKIGLISAGFSINDDSQHMLKLGYENLSRNRTIGFDIEASPKFCYGYGQIECLKHKATFFTGFELPHNLGNINFTQVDRSTNFGRYLSSALRYNKSIFNNVFFFSSLEYSKIKNLNYSANDLSLFFGINITFDNRVSSFSSYAKNSNSSSFTQSVSIQENPEHPQYGSGSISVFRDDKGQKNNNLNYNSEFSFMKYNLNVFQTSQKTDVSLIARGSMVYIPEENYFSFKKPIHSGLAYVKLENVDESIPILFENRYVGDTNDSGQYVVTDIIPLVEQKISVDINSLPNHLTIDNPENQFYVPYSGSVGVSLTLKPLPYFIRIYGVAKGTIFNIKNDTYIIGNNGGASVSEEGSVSLPVEGSDDTCNIQITRKQKEYFCSNLQSDSKNQQK